MGKIHLLTDDVINQIAAGEVVDRPSSVVKELVENALDAGADQIVVELEEGGIKRITVRDNGSGMDRDDAVLSLRRHATSKLSRAEDLFAIHSKGFRGEALAAISAVSTTRLRTRTQHSKAGTSIMCRGSENVEIDEWSGANGTEITITDLFQNIPARAAFLKSAASEYASCLELLQSLALISCASITLVHNGKERLRTSAVAKPYERFFGESDLRKRAIVLFEPEVCDQLLYCRKRSDFAELEALVSPPGLTRATQKYVTTFVNGRVVKDRGLKSAIIRGYHSHLLNGHSPIAVLNLWVNPSLVDVNVHPAKTEVRLQYAPDIQSTVAIAIREVLRSGGWSEMETHGSTGASTTNVSRPSSIMASFREPSSERIVRAEGLPLQTLHAAYRGDADLSVGMPRQPSTFVAPPIVQKVEGEGRIPWDQLRPAGSIFDCYLLFESTDRILMIDQHAFHERILYERLAKDRAQVIRSQPLLVPEVVDLSATEVELLVERQGMLKEFGFDFQKISETGVEVRALPSLLTKRSIDVVMGALANTESELPIGNPTAGPMHDILATIACHSAIRAGEQLSPSELQHLQTQSENVDFYHNCPHGRRVFKWWTEAQVASWFDR